jgi:[ribosomal protein S5]-alanine N-acetyltransferase
MPEDLEDAHAYNSDPRVWRYIGMTPAVSVDETRERVERLIRVEREHGYTLWPVVELDSGRVIGDCGLIPLERTGPEVELGYRLGSASWGKGYATEAALAARDLGFERFGLERIYVDVDQDNDGSLAVARKIGARLIGPATHIGEPVVRHVIERVHPG